MKVLLRNACVVAAASMASGLAIAQTYPAKPLRVITAEPGGGNDFAARVIGQAIAPKLGQPWIVDNRGGAGGAIAAEAAAKAPPDGYTLLVYAGNVWTIPLLRKNVRYEVKDFAPVTWAARSPSTLVVHPSLPVTNRPRPDRARESASRPIELWLRRCGRFDASRRRIVQVDGEGRHSVGSVQRQRACHERSHRAARCRSCSARPEPSRLT